jgi:hypothetical protein
LPEWLSAISLSAIKAAMEDLRDSSAFRAAPTPDEETDAKGGADSPKSAAMFCT